MALVEYFAMTRAALATINFAGVMSQQRVARIDRYLGTLGLPTEAEGISSGRRIERGAIRFDRVTFGYAGRSDVLAGLSLDVTAGEKVVLVGASGAGKSTIISLLLRFYSPGAGRIELDGSDIASSPLSAADVRRTATAPGDRSPGLRRSRTTSSRAARPTSSAGCSCSPARCRWGCCWGFSASTPPDRGDAGAGGDHRAHP